MQEYKAIFMGGEILYIWATDKAAAEDIAVRHFYKYYVGNAFIAKVEKIT